VNARGAPALAIDHQHGLLPAEIASKHLSRRLMFRRIHLSKNRRASPEINRIDLGQETKNPASLAEDRAW
jgi:hypothetical protein